MGPKLWFTVVALAFVETAPSTPWGANGHRMAARVAHAALPEAMPAFFRGAGPQLAYLNPEPDRWRNREMRAMDQAFAYDHYIDLENVPDGALEQPDRFTFLRALYDAGIERPEVDVGFLPYHMLELYQRLVTEWRLWRGTSDPAERRWIEARIVHDAGVLGHYVTDASQPHHTTIHFNGWSDSAANPMGFTTDRTFHARFEAEYVDAHVSQDDVSRRVRGVPGSVAGSARDAIWTYIETTHAEVERMYRIERDAGFDPDAPPRPSAHAFASERLAAGAAMLATLWRSAWEEGTR